MPYAYTPPPNHPDKILVSNRFMTCVLQFHPWDEFRVDHFQVIKLHWHGGATEGYKDTQLERRLRSDTSPTFYTAGETAHGDIILRISQIPREQRISTRRPLDVLDDF